MVTHQREIIVDGRHGIDDRQVLTIIDFETGKHHFLDRHAVFINQARFHHQTVITIDPELHAVAVGVARIDVHDYRGLIGNPVLTRHLHVVELLQPGDIFGDENGREAVFSRHVDDNLATGRPDAGQVLVVPDYFPCFTVQRHQALFFTLVVTEVGNLHALEGIIVQVDEIPLVIQVAHGVGHLLHPVHGLVGKSSRTQEDREETGCQRNCGRSPHCHFTAAHQTRPPWPGGSVPAWSSNTRCG